ncbi:unnamed protein product [Nippostrongylus brasiliensis]|uniref:Sushi domain-containing protein n=1 Tax=Nippostrongylus brasiliensis TaxID=27835 RepID=A0A0N4YF86_NIPBR|nr:unnamed protein product [Nippostrongylus brasiliensis]
MSLASLTVACQSVYECEYDYFLTGRREIAMNTLEVQSKLIELKHRGSQRIQSCGALLVAPGAVKYPPGNNYLDGVTVTYTCKPEYFIHGDPQRTCVNGSWTPDRSVEIGLKWMTGILSSVAIILFIASIFFACYLRRIALHPETGITFRQPKPTNFGNLSKFVLLKVTHIQPDIRHRNLSKRLQTTIALTAVVHGGSVVAATHSTTTHDGSAHFPTRSVPI